MLNTAAPSGTSRGELLTIRLLQLVGIAWLGAFVDPISGFLQAKPTLLNTVATFAGSGVFVGIYLFLWVSEPLIRGRRTTTCIGRRGNLRLWLPIIVMIILSMAFSLGHGLAWFELFIYASVGAGLRLPAWPAVLTIVGLMALAAILGVLVHLAGAPQAGSSLLNLVQFLLLIGAPGLAVATAMHSLTTVRELRAARAELARLAVAEERLRFARDLHDLLGRSLALIALKSELAGQLAAVAPERAVAEMRDVEEVARTALREVREAVSGYRRPTLANEVTTAREILAAAGITLWYDEPDLTMPSATEAVLAWALREGVTNVIRHSRARRCVIRFHEDGAALRLEIRDDGRGAPEPTAANAEKSGHGLGGLTERVAAVGGSVEAGPATEGGFQLMVVVPRPTTPPPERANAGRDAEAEVGRR